MNLISLKSAAIKKLNLEKIDQLQLSLLILGMLYMSIFLASLTVGYKLVLIHGQVFCASVFIFSILFPVNDVITELTNFRFTQIMIIATLFCEILFVSLTNLAIHLPSPPDWSYQNDYNFIIGGYARILLGDVVSLLAGFTANAFLLNKWKKMLKGNYFFIRAIAASAFGELIFTILTNFIAYYKTGMSKHLIDIIVSDYLFKLTLSVIICIPSAYFVLKIKKMFALKVSSFNLNPFHENIIKFKLKSD